MSLTLSHLNICDGKIKFSLIHGSVVKWITIVGFTQNHVNFLKSKAAHLNKFTKSHFQP